MGAAMIALGRRILTARRCTPATWPTSVSLEYILSDHIACAGGGVMTRRGIETEVGS